MIATMLLVTLACCVVVLVSGWGLAAAYYADDACQIDQWKCDLGNAGFTAGFYSAFVGAAALVGLLAVGGAHIVKRRGAS